MSSNNFWNPPTEAGTYWSESIDKHFHQIAHQFYDFPVMFLPKEPIATDECSSDGHPISITIHGEGEKKESLFLGVRKFVVTFAKVYVDFWLEFQLDFWKWWGHSSTSPPLKIPLEHQLVSY